MPAGKQRHPPGMRSLCGLAGLPCVGTWPALNGCPGAVQGVGLFTVDLENVAIAAGLRTWPQHV